jgi:hypothetical protein
LNAVDLEYVTFAALTLEVLGSPSAEEFAGFLKQTANAAKADAFLLPLQKDRGKLLSRWSQTAMAALGRAG